LFKKLDKMLINLLLEKKLQYFDKQLNFYLIMVIGPNLVLKEFKIFMCYLIKMLMLMIIALCLLIQ